MTPGYLLDLFTINQVRREEIGADIEGDVKFDLLKQDGHLLKELGKMLVEIADGQRPGFFAKHKQYDKGVGEAHNDNIIEVMYNLYLKHKKLWYLEDLRRDKNNSDKTRLDACDQVSVNNKQRNDLVENIDVIINNRLKQTKIWSTIPE
jgi:hypothetical protein